MLEIVSIISLEYQKASINMKKSQTKKVIILKRQIKFKIKEIKTTVKCLKQHYVQLQLKVLAKCHKNQSYLKVICPQWLKKTGIHIIIL